jgi:uncharacterized protein (DUF1800 family)
MNYSLNPYGQPLTAAQAAHLLRRATFGPTNSEIKTFTGLNASVAIQNLINSINYIPSPPVDLNDTKTTVGQEYVNSSYDSTLARNFEFRYYYNHWWINMMATQGGNPSIIDKMTLFWQNHFVTTESAVDEYRAIYKYFMKVRSRSLENFKDFVRDITYDPAMLKFLNGNENTKGTGGAASNENYARELQELFVVGAKDFAGNSNYTENDVKAAARVLTGWRYRNFYVNGTTYVDSYYTSTRHDTASKVFSANYQNVTINTPSATTPLPPGYNNVGEIEIDALLDMLFAHPETPKFICRKLYRFFVNPNVTQAIEDNVIVPLANAFKSVDAGTGRTFEIKPIIQKLLSSEHFYDVGNIGAIIKSPAEFIVGAHRFFNFPVPTIDAANLINSVKNHRTYAQYIYDRLSEMQMVLLDQPTVFGYDAYFQTGYSRNWINTSQIGLRNSFTDKLITGRTLVSGITPLVTIKIDMLAMVDLTNVNHNSTIPVPANYDVTDAAKVVELVTTNLLATPLTASQMTFLTDTIMLSLQPRTSWTSQWNSYKATPNTTNTNTVKTKLENLMKYLLRMAEYSIC